MAIFPCETSVLYDSRFLDFIHVYLTGEYTIKVTLNRILLNSSDILTSRNDKLPNIEIRVGIVYIKLLLNPYIIKLISLLFIYFIFVCKNKTT